VTPVKYEFWTNCYNITSYNYCKTLELWQQVQTACSQQLDQTQNVAEDMVVGEVNIIADNCVEHHVLLSDAETEVPTRSITETDGIVTLLQREVDGFTLDEHMRLLETVSIRLLKCDA
jgi:hypothetical protein